MLVALTGLAAPAPAARGQQTEEYSCGASHPRDVQEIIRLRDPGARSTSVDLSLDRAVIITDYLRLRAEGTAGATLRGIDEIALRRARDGGYVTPEVCAVVRFMHAYYARGKDASEETPPVARPTPPEESLPNVAAPPPAAPDSETAPPVPSERLTRREVVPEAKQSARAPRPRPESARTPSAPETPAEPPRRAPPAPLPAAQAEAPSAPPPDAEDGAVAVAALESRRAEFERREAEATEAVRRSALVVISEMESQLKVPPYLSFREVRTEAAKLSEEEVEARQQASLRATERVMAILTRLSLEPDLREAVQVSLGIEGRTRVEQGISRALRNLPDEAQRTRALTLWSELEASASRKR